MTIHYICTYINESTDYKESGCIRRVVSWQRP